MSNNRWYPEHLTGHARYCAHPSHSLMYHCAADPAEPATMRGEPSRAWIRDHQQDAPEEGGNRAARSGGQQTMTHFRPTDARPTEYGQNRAERERTVACIQNHQDSRSGCSMLRGDGHASTDHS